MQVSHIASKAVHHGDLFFHVSIMLYFLAAAAIDSYTITPGSSLLHFFKDIKKQQTAAYAAAICPSHLVPYSAVLSRGQHAPSCGLTALYERNHHTAAGYPVKPAAGQSNDASKFSLFCFRGNFCQDDLLAWKR